MKKIIELKKKHEAAARDLIAAVKAAYPVGSIVNAKITGGDNGTWIEAEVMDKGWDNTRWPLELMVRNTRTGKTRNVSADPHSHYRVELVRLPQNVEVARTEGEKRS